MGVLTWSPLAFGFLTGHHRDQRGASPSARAKLRPKWFDPDDRRVARKFEVADLLVQIADEIGRPLPALATAFPRAHRSVTSVITGVRTFQQLEATVKDTDLELDDEVLDRLDEIVPPGTDVYDPQSPCHGSPIHHCGDDAAPAPTRVQLLITDFTRGDGFE
jgi:aryl-alcohol dehydrogenase-like predicted oxidoreductase